jgi:hypothetical protein
VDVQLQTIVDWIETLPIELLPFLPRLLGGTPLVAGLMEIIVPIYYRRMEQEILARALEASMREHVEAHVPEPPKRVLLTPHIVSAAEARQGLECPVCLCQFNCREDGVVGLKCRHVFHRECLEPWFKEHHTCPVCRTDIDEGDESG